jgi:hypothetical protein
LSRWVSTFFASHIAVSHAYVHMVEVGTPVRVGGLTVRPGDLLHGDRHGVTNIPLDLAARIPEGVKVVDTMERQIINYSSRPNSRSRGSLSSLEPFAVLSAPPAIAHQQKTAITRPALRGTIAPLADRQFIVEGRSDYA